MALFPLALDMKTRLIVIIVLSTMFFISELIVAFRSRSLALLADAFHYLNDLFSFAVALGAQIVSEKAEARQGYSFGWQRATLLGAFFNGVFLMALGLSIFLQSIERFLTIQTVTNPMLVMVIGFTGLALNIFSAAFVGHGHDHSHSHDHGHSHDNGHSHDSVHSHHGHSHSHGHSHDHGHSHGNDHLHVHQHGKEHVQGQGLDQPNAIGLVNIESGLSKDKSARSAHTHAEHRHHLLKIKERGRDLGMLGVFVHLIGDAINNIGVIIAAVIIWQTTSPQRFYADPAASTFIAIVIFSIAIPQTKHSGRILLQSAPKGVAMEDVKHDLERIPGIDSVHELHIWRLNQEKAIASAHIVVSDEQSMATFQQKAHIINHCLHEYGIHSATLQPEVAPVASSPATQTASTDTASVSSSRRRKRPEPDCNILFCGLCKSLACCAKADT